MIFLNNHVLGISWLVAAVTSHKILPTLYILRGKQAGGAFMKRRWDEAKNSCSWFDQKREWGVDF